MLLASVLDRDCVKPVATRYQDRGQLLVFKAGTVTPALSWGRRGRGGPRERRPHRRNVGHVLHSVRLVKAELQPPP